MIKFFRRIRYDLMVKKSSSEKASSVRKTGSPAEASAKTGRYLKYAIGEIVLVMIGILLALQVNNWNIKNNERLYQLKQLSNLKLEIETMQEFLKFQITALESAVEGTKPLLELMGPQASMTVLPDSINRLFRKALNADLVTAEKLSFETQINFESIQEKNYDQLGKIL